MDLFEKFVIKVVFGQIEKWLFGFSETEKNKQHPRSRIDLKGLSFGLLLMMLGVSFITVMPLDYCFTAMIFGFLLIVFVGVRMIKHKGINIELNWFEFTQRMLNVTFFFSGASVAFLAIRCTIEVNKGIEIYDNITFQYFLGSFFVMFSSLLIRPILALFHLRKYNNVNQ